MIMDKCLQCHFTRIKYTLFGLRLLFSIYYIVNLVVIGHEQILSIGHDIHFLNRDHFHQAVIGAIVITVLCETLFTLLFIWSLYREHFGCILVLTTLGFVALLFDIGYIDSQITWLHVLDMCAAAFIVVIGYVFACLVSTKITRMETETV